MKRALYLLDEFRDIIQGKPGLEFSEIAGGHIKGLTPVRHPPAGQPATQRFVEDLAEGPSGAPRF